MNLAGDNPRFQAIKVSLGSLEFPIVQWTIEELWNRLYFSEGFRITPDLSWLRLYERVDTEPEGTELIARIPPFMNQIANACDDGHGWTKVVCTHAHALWVNGRASILAVIDWGDVEIICSGFGRISLSLLHAAGRLVYVSETEFLMPTPDHSSKHAGFIHVPTYPSPSSLCDVLTHVLTHMPTKARHQIVYDPRENHACLEATAYPEGAAMFTLRLYGSPLAQLLGYTSPMHERVFHRPASAENRRTADNYDFYVQNTDHPPLRLASDAFGAWHHVELTPGWYAPAHRPMCTGAPLRLPQELELCLNRLNFAQPERIPSGMVTGHFIIFTDPGGTTHNCPIYVGRYSAETLCAALETEMTRLARRTMPGTVFTVDYGNSRFTFCCEVADGDIVRPAPFSLLFHHPASIDPARIGFDTVALYGHDTYTSNRPISVPSHQCLLRPPINTYRVQEIGHQKRLRISPAPVPPLTGLILRYEVASHTLKLRMHAGQLPYAHGLVTGDVVHITASTAQEAELFGPTKEGAWEPSSARRCPVAPMWGRSGIVVDPIVPGGVAMPNSENTDVCLRVRPTPELADCCGMIVAINVEIQPFNLCFGMHRSVPPKTLGFPRGATQWGIDGANLSGRFRIPPFEAPAVHALDHPDYVLVYLNEGKTSAALQHRYGNNTTVPFCKLVLYPLFREERMLPRDTTLLSGESLSTFTLRFTNPDGTPYQFHNVDFSFSLNFIKVSE
tara:strand:- start:557 stop:2749 length:2193 start_codon:yes stop_codon:yes gene_type:complete